MRTKRILTLALATMIILVAPSALAQATISSYARAVADAVPPGGFQEGECYVQNDGNESVLLQVSADVAYADGRTQGVYRSGAPSTLPPGMGMGMFLLFVVAQDAALGTATFTCTFRATAPGGMVVQTPSDAFEVVPA